MSASVLHMSVSVDGFVAGPDGDVGRLHDWLDAPDGRSRSGRVAGRLAAELDATGAVVAGRVTAEQAGHWGGDHHRGVPVFVLSHDQPAPSVTHHPRVRYVTEGIESAMKLALDAAGDRDVLVRGAYTGERALAAGVLDEIEIHQVPVLFGAGLRFVEVLPFRVELELVRVLDTRHATHLRYRVRR